MPRDIYSSSSSVASRVRMRYEAEDDDVAHTAEQLLYCCCSLRAMKYSWEIEGEVFFFFFFFLSAIAAVLA